MSSILMKGIIRGGRVEVAEPIDLPDGSEVTIASAQNAIHVAANDQAWTDKRNDRRCELIDKKIDARLTPDEEKELEGLQDQMLKYRHRVAPLPLGYARQLLEELERKAAQANGPSA
jgi:hypothetical protein